MFRYVCPHGWSHPKKRKRRKFSASLKPILAVTSPHRTDPLALRSMQLTTPSSFQIMWKHFKYTHTCRQYLGMSAFQDDAHLQLVSLDEPALLMLSAFLSPCWRLSAVATNTKLNHFLIKWTVCRYTRFFVCQFCIAQFKKECWWPDKKCLEDRRIPFCNKQKFTYLRRNQCCLFHVCPQLFSYLS